MKTFRFAALVLAIALAFAGCQSRNNKNTSIEPTTPQSAVGEAVEDIGDGISNATSKAGEIVREGVDDAGDAVREGADKVEDFFDPDDHDGAPEEILEPSAHPTMSTDFSQIGALDAQKKGWGPGGPVDKEGRPNGATAYQDLYGKYDAFFIAPANGKIYLTFDEGYENSYTPAILDTLKEKNVQAVFFVTLPYVKSEPELVKRMIDEGHIIGNHSCAHKSFPDMPLSEAASDIMGLHDYMMEHFGYKMTLFRPPMGEFSEQTLALTQSLGYQSVFWSFAYRDWLVDDQPLTIDAVSTTTGKLHTGAIYLLHAVSQTNAEILGEFIDTTRSKGFEFAAWNL